MRYPILFLAVVAMLAACSDSPTTPNTVPATTTTTGVTPATAGDTSSPTTNPESRSTTTTVTTSTMPVRSLDDLVLEGLPAGTGFGAPVLMVTPPDDERRFVVQQSGLIHVLDGGEPELFLDISELVRFQGEQGLLGLAFPPDFADTGLLYVDFVDNDGATVIASLEAEGNTALDTTLKEIMRIDQPAGNHNGGMIQFGPDANLWIGMGDGGGGNDQFGNGQREDTPLAAMLRITVGAGIDGYAIPDGNLAGEVWAIGLRNPWRWSFDDNDLWIADVGQNQIEEVDVVDWREGNPNFGWSIQEASSCFGGGDCDKSGLVQPIYEYTHADGCSITGGFVYHGVAIPELAGQFFFADYCTGWLRSVDKSGSVREWFPAGTFPGTTGFGKDADGELYVLTNNGDITKLVPAQS